MLADGHLGFWAALAQVWPEAAEQRCWNHQILNVLDQWPKKVQAEARALLKPIPTRPPAPRRKAGGRPAPSATGAGTPRRWRCWKRDWERLVTFYDFPEPHWRHLRTTNVVESPFAAVRLRTSAAKRFKQVANVTALIWRLLMVAERRFRKLNAPELLAAIARGQRSVDGQFVSSHRRAAA